MNLSTQIILDPAAFNHRTGRMWQACQRECLRELAPAEIILVESAEEAEQATRFSALKGHRRIISVGGKETIHGVVNGLMGLAENHRREMMMGLLSLVRPDEWSRTINLPKKLSQQLEMLKAGHVIPFDIGHVDCHSETGIPTSRYFLNGSAFGLSGQIKQELASHSQQLPETLQALARTLNEFLIHRGPRIRMEKESEVFFEGHCTLVFVMGGQYYPSLGEITPQADPADGALDVVWVTAPKWFDRVFGMLRLLSPIPPPSDPPYQLRAMGIRAVSLDGPVYLEADGIFLGRLPATFSTIPRTLPIITPAVGVKHKKLKFTPLPDMGKGSLAGYSRSYQDNTNNC